MHRFGWSLLVLLCTTPLLAGCNEPSNSEVVACVKSKITARVEISPSGPIICSEYVDVLGTTTADHQINGTSARVVANMRWKSKAVFGKSSHTASVCFVSIEDWSSYYQVDEIANSKVEIELEKWASGWKCKN